MYSPSALQAATSITLMWLFETIFSFVLLALQLRRFQGLLPAGIQRQDQAIEMVLLFFRNTNWRSLSINGQWTLSSFPVAIFHTKM